MKTAILVSLLFGGALSFGQTPAGSTKPLTKIDPKDGLKYVWIPSGTFMMGGSPGDSEWTSPEKPTHQVTLSKGFWIGQTEVTVGAYKRFASATREAMPSAPSFNEGWNNDQIPIVIVSWDDATAYCAWAGGRLPTEAEWEYAARGGNAEARYGALDEVAWYGENSGNKAHEVGQKRENGFGLFDMLGNVSEWVNDWYGENSYQGSPERDPQGSQSGELRVVRGGSYVDDPWGARVSYRSGQAPDARSGEVGFRCSREAITP